MCYNNRDMCSLIIDVGNYTPPRFITFPTKISHTMSTNLKTRKNTGIYEHNTTQDIAEQIKNGIQHRNLSTSGGCHLMFWETVIATFLFGMASI